MNHQRRQALQAGSAAAVLVTLGLLKAEDALASYNDAAFKTKTLADTLKALGASAPAESKDVQLVAPDIAENGAVVPMTIRSALPNTQMAALLVEKNPFMLAGYFELFPGLEPEVRTNVKMAQSSDVIALVKAGDKFYMTRKEVKITLGGCGG